MAVGSDDERSHGGRHVPNHTPTVASSVLNQDIAGKQRHLRATVELECQVAGENDPEIRRVGPVKAGVSSTEFVAILEVHLGSGFWCNEGLNSFRSSCRPHSVLRLATCQKMPNQMKRVLSEVRQTVRNPNPCKVEHFG